MLEPASNDVACSGNKSYRPCGRLPRNSGGYPHYRSYTQGLNTMVEEKLFCEDLYYRLNVINIPVPPLREQPEDIIPLCLVYLKKFNRQYNLNKSFSLDVLEEFTPYNWPGNVREQKNVVEHLIVVSGDVIQKSDFAFLVSDIGESGELAGTDIVVRRIIPMNKTTLQKACKRYQTCGKSQRFWKWIIPLYPEKCTPMG